MMLIDNADPQSRSSLLTLIGAVLLLTSLPAPVLAVAGAEPNSIIQNMLVNTWYEVPNSNMSQVEARNADYPGIWGNHPDDPTPKPSNFQSSQGVFPWSGGVFDSKRNRMVLWGGGHNAYYGNELYAFDLTTLSWERVNSPSPPTDHETCIDILSDGNPNSRHTYYNLAYIPTTDKFFSTPAGTTSCDASGIDNHTWSFDFDTKKWLDLDPATESDGSGKPKQPPGWAPTAAAYNPLDNKVYSVGPAGLFVYDVVANRWDKLNSIALWEDRGAAVDVKRGLLIVVGRGEVVVYDLVNQNYTPQFWDTEGDETYNIEGKNGFRPGVNYDPVADRIVVWDGGAVHALNMDTRQWDDLAVAPQARHSTGTYGRFRYSQRENAYVLVNDSTENVLIYRLADNTAVLNIVVQPTAVAVDQGQTATFNVLAVGNGMLNYQWRKNGVNINGTNTASYSLTASDMADNNAMFDVVVSNASDSVTSSAATLTIVADTIAPVVDAVGTLGPDIVQVVFSESVTQASAENIANYIFAPAVTIDSAVLTNNGQVVLLTATGLGNAASYSLTLKGISDRAPIPNTITDTTVDFFYRTSDDFENGNADGWTPLKAAHWEVMQDEGDNAYYLNTTGFDSPGDGQLGEYSLLPGNFGNFTLTLQAKLGDDVNDNGFADYAVVFGYQDESNYYYAMFNNEQDATQLAKVVNGRRTELVTADTDWLSDNFYHSIKISRAGDEIKVYFDDNLILSAIDTTFSLGRLGVGSFNDSAYFDDVSITAGEGSDLALEIRTASLGSAQVDEAISYPITATGGTAPYVWNISTGALPEGLTLNTSTGGISGTPMAAGTYSFTLRVQDGDSASDTQPLSLIVATATAAMLEISTASLGSAQVDEAISYPITATGGTAPYVWNISTGALPEGLTLNTSTGGISGTPMAAGTYSFTLRVQDSDSASDTQPLSLTVATAADNSADSSGGGGTLGPLLGLVFILLVFSKHWRRYNFGCFFHTAARGKLIN